MKTMLHKYRFLIRHLPKYPSRSRDRLLVLVKEDFRLNRNEGNTKKFELLQAEVDAGIKEINRYRNLNKSDQNWTFHL